VSITTLASNLEPWLDQEIAAAGATRVAVHAGHYILTYLATYLAEQIEARGALDEFAAFTRYSWQLGCRLVASASRRGQTSKLLVLVNDWQFVKPPAGLRRAAEREAAALRSQYFSHTRTLPEYHLRILREAGLTGDDVLKGTEEQWLFSESELRTALVRSVARLFEEEKATERGLTKHYQPSGDPIVSVCADLGAEMDLIFCGSTNCAGEIIELLRVLRERNVGLLVNLYPRPCFGQVSTGTMLAGQIYGLEGMRIVNVAIPLGVDGASGGNIVEKSSF
jgi:hypothetical protein